MLAKFAPFKVLVSACTCQSLARIRSCGHPSTVHQKVTRRRGLGGGRRLDNRQFFAKEHLLKMNDMRSKLGGVL